MLDNMHQQNIPHPSTFIDAIPVQTLRQYAPQAEQLQQLHPQQVALIYQQQWLNLYVPTQYGGQALTLQQGLNVEEAIAWADGSVGWTVTLCSGANWFVGFLAPELAQDIFRDEKVCLAGSGRSTGIATDFGDYYTITGYWNYATGAFMATAFTANCVIEKDGIQVKNEDGSALIKSFVFLKDEVMLHQTWKTIGMIATGSNSFEVYKLIVPKNRAFTIDVHAAVIDAPIYHYPFQQFAEATLAVNSSGMAMRFLDLCKPADINPGILSLEKWTGAVSQLQTARNNFYEAIHRSWQCHLKSTSISIDLLGAVTSTSRALAAISLDVTDKLYPLCGMAAANPATEINRLWRNLHTASQHTLLLPQQ
jgi:indole-3-acetate monooxygenase